MDDASLAWEVTASELAYSCPGFDIVREEVRLPDGTETDFDYLTEPPSVVVLPFTPNEDVVLVREWREAVKRVNRGLPAGTADPDDDSLAESARRELREETGYAAGEISHLVTVEPANGLAAIEHHYYVAQDCEHVGAQQLDPDETIEVDTVAYEQLREDVHNGEVRDGRTVLGILYHAASGA